MASQTSLKELSKTLSIFFSSEPTVPIPNYVSEVLAAYLRRHPKYDEATAERLQEELMSIFDKQVRGNIFASTAWIGILRRLLPMILTPARIMMWIDALKGVISERTTHEKGAVEEIVSVLMELVDIADEFQELSDGDPPLNPIMHHLLTVWMDRLYPAWVTGIPNMEYNERMFRDALTAFGKRRPQQLFASLDSFFVQKKYRKAALRFICEFIQNRPPHLHQILQGTLFKNLLTCLQEDTSSAVVSSALTALIMFLPHMPSSLVPHLPVLFNIYARVLFWNQELAEAVEPALQDVEKTSRWEVYAHVPDVDEASVTHVAEYYTILYGLYPINFMDYIRKPQRYLRHANVADANDMEVQPTEIRDQSERFRRCHILHPNFYTLTIDSEKTDFGRWIKSEAAQVVAECMELCIPSDPFSNVPQLIMPLPLVQSPLAPEDPDKDSSNGALLSKATTNDAHNFRDPFARANSTSTLVRHNSQSSFTSNRELSSVRSHESIAEGHGGLTQSPSYTQLQDIIQANKAIKSGLHDNDGPGLSSRENSTNEQLVGARSPTPTWVNPPLSTTDINPQVSHLKRQNMMLQNDLSFERYQKQQHIAHIGELRRKQVTEAATEAETQNLIMMNRNLKSRYEEAKKAEMQVRKESEKSRALAKKWEADLSNKVKNLRDQSQKTNSELQGIRRELEDARQEGEKLLRLVVNGEVRELNWKQNMQSIEMHGAEIDRLKAEVERLTILERDHQAKEQKQLASTEFAAAAERKVEELNMKLAAQEMELQTTRRVFQLQLAELQTKLTAANGQCNSRTATEYKAEIKSFLATNEAKQEEAQKQYDLLLRKYTALQSSLLDMQSGATPEQIKMDAHSLPVTGGGLFPHRGVSPVKQRTRPRIVSNPDEPGAALYNITAPLDVSGQRPGTPSVAEAGPSAISPEQRYHGRALGGVQNRAPKVKSREEGAPSGKREKKTTGLKAFVRGVKE